VTKPATTVAVLGTGTMGAPMARKLLRAGFDVRVWNRTVTDTVELRSEPPHGANVANRPGP
jgi:3-hydroxyisobutyrate dehydrogenase